jgi:molybdate transport system substrate-binding protein
LDEKERTLKMKKASLLFIVLIVLSFTFAGCGGQAGDEASPPAEGTAEEAVEVNISAASSLTDALTEIQTEFAKESKAVLRFNYGASGTLQQQIEQGAPCDLFISASKANMDSLEEAGLIVPGSRKNILGNSLTLIAAAEKSDVIKDYGALSAGSVQRISVGMPDLVPAGKYAQQSLQNLNVWDQIQEKIVNAKDVKQVLQYVDSGNVDCGIVYKTDAMIMKTGVVVLDLPESSHDPIVYPAALIKDSAQPAAAEKFYDFLQTDYAKGVFEKYGFTIQ